MNCFWSTGSCLCVEEGFSLPRAGNGTADIETGRSLLPDLRAMVRAGVVALSFELGDGLLHAPYSNLCREWICKCQTQLFLQFWQDDVFDDTV